MAQIYVLPRTMTLTRQFEELALFTEKAPNGDIFFAGLIDGRLEVSYDLTGDWYISDIEISIENGRRCKDGGTSKMVNVNADENPSLYWLLLDRLTDVYASTISEWVSDELAWAA